MSGLAGAVNRRVGFMGKKKAPVLACQDRRWEGVSKRSEAGESAALELPIRQENRLEPLDLVGTSAGCSRVCHGTKAGREVGPLERSNDNNRRSNLVIEVIDSSSCLLVPRRSASNYKVGCSRASDYWSGVHEKDRRLACPRPCSNVEGPYPRGRRRSKVSPDPRSKDSGRRPFERRPGVVSRES